MNSRLLKLVSSRLILLVIAVMLQIVMLVNWLYRTSLSHNLAPIITLVSYALVVRVVNTSEDPNYKLTWCVLILVWPILGIILYVLCAGRKMPKKLANGTTRASEYLYRLLHQDRAVMEKLQEEEPDLCKTFSYGQRMSQFPVYNNTEARYFGEPIPIRGVAPDGHMGMFGIDGVHPGTLTVTYGTGSFMHLVTGGRCVAPENGLTASRCCSLREEKIYQLNGICYTAGTAVKWLQNGLGILENDKESAAIARSVPDSGGVIFVPAFTGLAMPWWDQEARGALLGLTAGVTRAHVIRAVLESLAAQVATNLEIMRESCPGEISCIYALGGITANDFLMQYQADLAGIPVIIPDQTEPCFGAAKLALISCLGEDCLAEFETETQNRVYFPTKNELWRKEKLAVWNQGVARCLSADVYRGQGTTFR